MMHELCMKSRRIHVVANLCRLCDFFVLISFSVLEQLLLTIVCQVIYIYIFNISLCQVILSVYIEEILYKGYACM
jgi:hypothetical protein